MNDQRSTRTLRWLGNILVTLGIILFSIIDYPPALVAIPPITVTINLVNPFAILYLPGSILLVAGMLVHYYLQQKRGSALFISPFRLVYLLLVLLLSTLVYNKIFIGLGVWW